MKHEAGVSLPEVLVTISILGIIIAPIAAALMVTVRTSDQAAERLTGSHDAQLVSLYLPSDLHSAGSSTDVIAAPTANTDCSGVTNLLRIRWSVTETDRTDTYIAAYRIRKPSDEYELVRHFCKNDVPQAELVVAHNLAGTGAGTVSTSGRLVTMTLTEATTPNVATAYIYSVSGARRAP